MAKYRSFAGIEKEDEITSDSIIKDTRTPWIKFTDSLADPTMLATSIAACAVPAFLWQLPFVPEVCLVAGLFLAKFGLSIKYTLPFRMPMSAKLLDWNDLHPGTREPVKSRGIGYYGNRLRDDGEIWFSDDDLRTHILIFGSTGSGKTEALLSFAYNALAQGSGFIYVDGKGDNSLFGKIYGMVRSRGREDDLLVINYMTGNSDVSEGPKASRLSNTTNPFANGSSDGLTQLMVGLMDGGEKGGDMWKGRAASMIGGILMALVSMRDRGEILLDVQAIRDYMTIEKIISLSKDETLTEKAKNSLKAYLDSLPGYVASKGAKQGDTTLEQHGYLTMQFTKIMGSLSDTYGHIFKTQLGEVDFYDVVVNRRILVVLLPALEKAPDELANLGKIIVASLKSMMATGLGAGIEGTFKDVVESKPNNSPSPYTTILDEYGYYAVPGSAVMPAQARSLGFSMIFAGQDLPAFEKASPEEAASIIGNCNIKIFMKLEESEKTFNLFDKSVGEAYVTHTGGFQSTTGVLGNVYQDGNNANIERRSRGSLQDLQKQSPGEAHILFGGSVVRVRLFRANPPTPSKMLMLVNRFLKVAPPSKEQMDSFTENSKILVENLTSDDFIGALSAPSSMLDINMFSDLLKRYEDKPASEIGNYTLANYRVALDESGGKIGFDEEDEDDIDNLEGFIPEDGDHSIFGDKKSEDIFLKDLFGAEGAAEMANMMGEDAGYLDRNATKGGIADIEMALGVDEKSAVRVGDSVIHSIEEATGYPSEPVGHVEVEDWVEAMKEIESYISGLDSEQETKD